MPTPASTPVSTDGSADTSEYRTYVDGDALFECLTERLNSPPTDLQWATHESAPAPAETPG